MCMTQSFTSIECNPELEPEHESEAMDCDIVVIVSYQLLIN